MILRIGFVTLVCLVQGACGVMPVPSSPLAQREVVARPLPLQAELLPADKSQSLYSESRVEVKALPAMPDLAALDSGGGLDLPRPLPQQPAAVPLPAAAAPAGETRLQSARSSFQQGDYATATALLREAGVSYGDGDAGGRLLDRAAEALYRRYLQQQEMSAAEELSRQVLREQPGAGRWQKRLQAIEARRQAARYFREYRSLPATSTPQQRYDLLQQVLQLDPDHRQAAAAQTALQVELAEALHQQALRFYRQQQLQPAIEQWQRALQLNGSHEQAQVYLSRARDLQRRLHQLQ